MGTLSLLLFEYNNFPLHQDLETRLGETTSEQIDNNTKRKVRIWTETRLVLPCQTFDQLVSLTKVIQITMNIHLPFKRSWSKFPFLRYMRANFDALDLGLY